jgi:hypothetical protein
MQDLADYAQQMAASTSEAVALLAKITAEIGVELAEEPEPGTRQALLDLRREVESAGPELGVGNSRASVIASRVAGLVSAMEASGGENEPA